jgi:hypothetical protein
MKERFANLSITTVLPYFGFGLVLLVVKLALISFYGSATPYWDQWDAEAALLYSPWLDGTFSWGNLFAPHNEHRIFTTRLLALFLLKINGQVWDPILQMQVNAGLHVLALCVLLFYVSKLLPKIYKAMLFVFCAVMFSIPFGWENTLAGFQSQFYFLLLFSFIFLWAMAAYKIYSLKWWAGFLFGLLCLLTLASGALTVLAGALIIALRKVMGNKNISASSIILLLAISTIAIALTPSIPGHASLKAQSISQFLMALSTVFSWPQQKMSVGVFVIQMPLLIFMFLTLRKPDFRTPSHFFIFAMGLWLFGQFVSLAYGRAVGVTSSRYLDLLAIGLVINFAALLILFVDSNKYAQTFSRVGAVIWLITITTGFAMSSGRLSEDLRTKAKQNLEQEKNVRAYLCTGDSSNLLDKPFLYTPYPNSERLQNLLDNPTIRSILPGNIYGPNSTHPIGPDGEPFCDPGKLVRPYEVRQWKADDDVASIAETDAIIINGWHGTDYFKSEMPGYKVIGSFINSENDTGTITLHLHRGDSIFYRSGPRVSGQIMLINNGGVGKYYTNLPPAIEWSVLTFTNESLPEEFDLTLIDGGTKLGEWSAIAVKKHS